MIPCVSKVHTDGNVSNIRNPHFQKRLGQLPCSHLLLTANTLGSAIFQHTDNNKRTLKVIPQDRRGTLPSPCCCALCTPLCRSLCLCGHLPMREKAPGRQQGCFNSSLYLQGWCTQQVLSKDLGTEE